MRSQVMLCVWEACISATALQNAVSLRVGPLALVVIQMPLFVGLTLSQTFHPTHMFACSQTSLLKVSPEVVDSVTC